MCVKTNQKPLWKDAIKWTEDAFVLQIFRIMVPFSEKTCLRDPVQMLDEGNMFYIVLELCRKVLKPDG